LVADADDERGDSGGRIVLRDGRDVAHRVAAAAFGLTVRGEDDDDRVVGVIDRPLLRVLQSALERVPGGGAAVGRGRVERACNVGGVGGEKADADVRVRVRAGVAFAGALREVAETYAHPRALRMA